MIEGNKEKIYLFHEKFYKGGGFLVSGETQFLNLNRFLFSDRMFNWAKTGRQTGFKKEIKDNF